MSSKFVRNGDTHHVGDVVKLNYDEEFSSWNGNINGKLGMIVNVKSYDRLRVKPEDEIVDILVDGKIVSFEWEDVEIVK